ncbi:hypothetical protein JTB14_000295 [Gonioctena quinquepunctata]|nr:hypothetical protein JTB14_000295 [Gonioctena quinquepunctata]
MGKILSQAGGYSTGDITTKELEPVTEAATNLYPDWLEDSDQYSDDHNENIDVPLPSKLFDVQEVSMEVNESIVESPPLIVKPSSLQKKQLLWRLKYIH